MSSAQFFTEFYVHVGQGEGRIEGQDSRSSRKFEVIRLIDETDQAASSLQDRGQQIVAEATYARDLGIRLRNFVQDMPSDSSLSTQGWDNLAGSWSAARNKARVSLDLFQASTFSGTMFSSALTTSVTVAIADIFALNTPATVELKSFLGRPVLFQAALDALTAFGLNVPPKGGRSPTDLLTEGHDALIKPSSAATSPASVLMPARGSVTQALAMLLPRRPKQEPAKRQIIAIGAQCCASGFDADHFARLDRNWGALLDRLSDSKVASMQREEIEIAFEDVLRFHAAFLKSLDQSKMR